MKYRKLRIAWSIAWGVMAVLMITLWVRSYWWIDIAMGRQNALTSLRGSVIVSLGKNDGVGNQAAFASQNLREARLVGLVFATPPTFGFEFRQLTKAIEIVLPHGLLVLATVGMASAPWIRWRFSLRTLLIATTLFAVALGLVVYSFR